MKQFLMGVFAVMLAFGAVAFTKADKSPKLTYYWFQYDASGNQITQSAVPTAMTNDPAICGGATNLCSSGFTAYEPVPGSSPVQYQGKGTPPVTHRKN